MTCDHTSHQNTALPYMKHFSIIRASSSPEKFFRIKNALSNPHIPEKKSASETVNAFFILVGLIILSKDFVIHIKLGLSILTLHIQNIIQSSLSICSTHTLYVLKHQ